MKLTHRNIGNQEQLILYDFGIRALGTRRRWSCPDGSRIRRRENNLNGIATDRALLNCPWKRG